MSKRLSLLQAAESKPIDFGSVPNIHIRFSLAYTACQQEPRVRIVPEMSDSTFSAIRLCECVSMPRNLLCTKACVCALCMFVI